MILLIADGIHDFPMAMDVFNEWVLCQIVLCQYMVSRTHL